MKNSCSIIILVCTLVFAISCQNDREILNLLNSQEKEDIIRGAYLAGESGDKKFSPMLLKNVNDVRTSTNLKFKGYNVYQEKMIALNKIYKQSPPVQITNKPDSVIIKFYIGLVERTK